MIDIEGVVRDTRLLLRAGNLKTARVIDRYVGELTEVV
jgi:hypothetical protein